MSQIATCQLGESTCHESIGKESLEVHLRVPWPQVAYDSITYDQSGIDETSTSNRQLIMPVHLSFVTVRLQNAALCV